jgi:phosphoenolpyruvate synthase/pyruvate phosphate dikinase
MWVRVCERGEKPFTPDQLLKATERSLEGSKGNKSSISKTGKEREMIEEARQLYEWPDEKVVAGRTFKGIPASPGVIEGQATVITDHTDFLKIKTDTILVCPYMSPELTTIFPWIKGVVTDHGGKLASAATIAREYGIPAVAGTLTATESINDGDIIRVDGTEGHVEIISPAR